MARHELPFSDDIGWADAPPAQATLPPPIAYPTAADYEAAHQRAVEDQQAADAERAALRKVDAYLLGLDEGRHQLQGWAVLGGICLGMAFMYVALTLGRAWGSL